jgi:LmbE family N-acetylglucosaminyl deacetylase
MNLSHPQAEIFVPDGTPEGYALRRITRLAVGAHQDDCEIMAFHGILACHGRADEWFAAVVCTNGSGSPRAGSYAAMSDGEMARLRRREQEKAAVVGGYGALIQLNHASAAVKDPNDPALREDLAAVFGACKPRVVYLHNLADKHPTHQAVGAAALRALRTLPPESRPEAVYGCEVWRGLDWLPDRSKVALDLGRAEHLQAALIGVYDSQVAGGKRYDLATLGRARANATYSESHATDKAESLWFAMDLTPLVKDPSLDIRGFVLAHVDELRREIGDGLARLLPDAP